jgi:hypothetical protein
MYNLFSDTVPNSLSSELENFETWVKIRLGENPTQTVELTTDQIWFGLLESDMVFSSEVNTAQARNMMSHFYGMDKNTDISNSNNRFTFSYLNQISKNYGAMVGVGGDSTNFLGHFDTVPGQQTYYLPDHLLDSAGSAVDFTSNDIIVMDIYQNDIVSTKRFIDTWSYYNIMAGEFGVQSALYNTMFAMLPVNANVAMMQHTKYNNKLRLSNYTWEYDGKVLSVFPKPGASYKIFIKYRFKESINQDVSITGDDRSSVTAANSGIGNLTQMKTSPLDWDTLNSIAKVWIRRYGLSLCKEILGFNRGKFITIPFAGENNTAELDYKMFIEQATTEKEQLRVQLREDLDRILNHTELLKRDAESAKYLNEQLQYFPMGLYWR